MYKKVYVEITNNCNLNCDFCTHNKRENKFISVDDFKIVLDKLKGHTDYIYMHVLGEPLLHPDINELINIASLNYKINITTNGYLIDRIKDNHNIRQVNISLHSYTHDDINSYLNKIFEVANNLSDTTYISYRLWVRGKYTKEIVDSINKRYNVNIDINNIPNEIKLSKNIYFNTHEEFVWPSLDRKEEFLHGKCYALKDHIGILVDGSIVPCCLDGDGIITLGNIYNDSLNDIINSKRYQDMLNGFKNNIKCEKLCQKCNFIK